MLNQDQIQKEFEKFGISKDEVPKYIDPYTFTKQIKKCSLYQVDQISYAGSTIPPERISLA